MSFQPIANDELELRIERRIELPVEQLFDLWTRPEHLREWWGPTDDDGQSFHVFFREADIREGGAWRVGMRARGGKEYWQHGVYQAIVRPSRLMFTLTWENDDPDGAEMLIDVSLVAEGDATLMRFRQSRFSSHQSRDAHIVGWEQCFGRLTDYAQRRRV